MTCIHVADYSVQFLGCKIMFNRTCSHFDRVFACTIILVHVNCMPKRMSCGCVVGDQLKFLSHRCILLEDPVSSF